MFGIIGKPLNHSFSPDYFQKKFSMLGLPYIYRKFELKSIGELPDLLKRNPDLSGLNVTIPYKSSVLPYLDSISDEAKAIGAVNCIKISGNRLQGYNTDVRGFEQSLLDFLPPKSELKALVLGTGGSSKAVCYVLRKLGIPYQLVSRKISKSGIYMHYSEITPEVLNAYLLIINTTPLGMWPDVQKRPELPYQALSASHHLFDLIYHPAQTRFLKAGQEKGAAIQNGLAMLYGQAEASWAIWMQQTDP